MKIGVSYHNGAYEYRLQLEDEDRTAADRRCVGDGDRVRLVRDRWNVVTPGVRGGIHPDLHATAIWLVVRPFLGGRLELPFGVSVPFAARMQEVHGVTFASVDPTLAPREAPRRGRPLLLFSGGYDSTAASLVVAPETAIVHVARIPHYFTESPEFSDTLLRHLARGRELCDMLRYEGGRDVYLLREDHEVLCRPYPTWHSGQDMAFLGALYLADALDISVVETGAVLCNLLEADYRFDDPRSWVMGTPRQRAERSAAGSAPRVRASQKTAIGFGAHDEWELLGLRSALSVAGLSTVATFRMVEASPYHGRAFSCDFKGHHAHAPYVEPIVSACLRCDRCFQKLLLGYVFRDLEVPPELIDHFMSVPELAAIFARPFPDWHHVWLYMFQRIRCSHPWIRALAAQAERAPDMAFLERWHPDARLLLDPAFRDVVEARILERVDAMTDEDMRVMREVPLPPLQAPYEPVTAARAVFGEDAPPPDADSGTVVREAQGPGGEHVGADVTEDPSRYSQRSEAAETVTRAAPDPGSFSSRPNTLRVLFQDRQLRSPDRVFFLGACGEGDVVFRREGSVGLAHSPCPSDVAFQMAVDALIGAARTVGAPPTPENKAAWRHAIREALAKTALVRRFDCVIELA